MAKLVLSIEIDKRMADSIENERIHRRNGKEIKDGQGWFNNDGRIALDGALLERDYLDDSFFVFNFEGIKND